MSKCPKCLAENNDEAKFCKQCSSPLNSSGGKTCPNGRHIMDPNWAECTYCRSEGLLGTVPSFASGGMNPAVPMRNPTVVEGRTPSPAGLPPRQPTYMEGQPLAPRSAPKPFVPPQSPHSPPPVPQPPPSTISPGKRNPTVFSPIPTMTPGGVSSPPPLSAARKIVGILVTYSWRPEGQVFPLREGRNLIGRDSDCDVCIPEDQTMSGRNSHITFRQNFVVGDMVSMMGTDLDGVPIEEQFKSLGNYAAIRAGSTHFIFMMVEAPRA